MASRRSTACCWLKPFERRTASAPETWGAAIEVPAEQRALARREGRQHVAVDLTAAVAARCGDAPLGRSDGRGVAGHAVAVVGGGHDHGVEVAVARAEERRRTEPALPAANTGIDPFDPGVVDGVDEVAAFDRP